MSNGEKSDSLFLVDNKEATVNAINNIKKIIKTTLGQIEQLKSEKIENKEVVQLCENTIKNLYLLIDTIDKERNTTISKDLDYLYKHCLFSVVRVRDHKDYEFLDGCIQILSDITEGWDRVGSAVKRAPAFG
tara:strand:+ start:330 stop:725 length:396 start_codon:yes stop_codon:yes gene_type:complete